MDFTIIGAGNMGKAIGTRLLSGGSSVIVMDRDNQEAKKLAEALRPAVKGGATVSAASMGDPIKSEAVILAVYYPSISPILVQYGNQLVGKIIIDISNPLNATYDDLGTPAGISSAEETARLAPAGAKVIKAFNTTFAGTLLAGKVAGQTLDVFMAGDDLEAKTKLAKAFSAGGLRPIDVGPLRRARQLEGIGLLHITLQGSLGTNWGSIIKILP